MNYNDSKPFERLAPRKSVTDPNRVYNASNSVSIEYVFHSINKNLRLLVNNDLPIGIPLHDSSEACGEHIREHSAVPSAGCVSL